MMSIEQRATKEPRLWAFVAADTIGPIIDRIVPMVRSGRRMTMVDRYMNDSDALPHVYTGLILDPDARDGGVMVREQANPRGKSLSVIFHRANMWGVSAYDGDGTEDEVAARFRADSSHERRNAERIEVHGGLWGPRADDRIVLTRYNEYGVGHQIILAFDTPVNGEESAADATVLDLLAATGKTFTSQDLSAQAERLRWHMRTLADDLARTDD